MKIASYGFKYVVFLTVLALSAGCSTGAQIPTPTTGGSAFDVQVAVSVALTQTAVAVSAPVQPSAQPALPEATSTPLPVATEPPAATDTPSVTHTMIPAASVSGWTTITDTSSAAMASQKRAPGGEDYNMNRFERPFTSGDMVYHPEVDIQTAKLGYDSHFYYVDIAVQGVNPDTKLIDGTYAVEFDVNNDGRGDYIVIAKPPFGQDWSTTTMFIGKDANDDVGGPHPLESDAPYKTDGYETTLFTNTQNQDPDMAWSRLSPDKANTIEIAFKRSLLSSGEFMWGVWADNGNNDLALQDINDRFTSQEAGTSIYGLPYYPLAKVALLDNTCRWTFGFTPTGKEPGLCAGAVAPTTPPTGPGHIVGFIYFDNDFSNGYDSPPDTPSPVNSPVKIYSGTSCSGSPVQTITATSTFTSSALTVGKYCVHIDSGFTVVPANNVVVTVSSGTNVEVDFGLQGPK
jgi:hypothetical protein